MPEFEVYAGKRPNDGGWFQRNRDKLEYILYDARQYYLKSIAATHSSGQFTPLATEINRAWTTIETRIDNVLHPKLFNYNFIEEERQNYSKKCPRCQTDFETANNKQVYCSSKCWNRYIKKECVEKTCLSCNKTFFQTNPKQKFDSEKCRKKFYNSSASRSQRIKIRLSKRRFSFSSEKNCYIRKDYPEKPCLYCISAFKPKTITSKFCSRFCKQKNRRKNRVRIVRSKPEKIEKPCLQCLTNFKPKQDNARFCSRTCNNKYYWKTNKKQYSVERLCQNCGKPFIARNFLAKFCHKSCHNKHYHRNFRVVMS